jgi:hypothetical protein
MVHRSANQAAYPLSALFVLVAVFCMVAAHVAPVVQSVVAGKVGFFDALLASAVGAGGIMILGGIMGLYHHRPLRGCAWGVLVGGFLGSLIGPIILAPPEIFVPLAITSLTGAAVLLLIGGLVHLSPRRPR